MKAEDIQSADDLGAWLKGLPEDQALRVAPQLAFRAAARVFPLWGSIETRSTTSRSDASSLPLLRAMCLQWIAFSDIQGLNKNVFRSCRKYVSEGVNGGFQIVRPAASNMLRTRAAVGNVIVSMIEQKHFDTIWRANDSIDHAAVEKNFIDISVVDPLRGDALFYGELELSNDSSETRLINFKLWPTQPPDWFTRADRETRAIWAEDPETWSFWERWWDGLISGTMPFPLELLREVVLIGDGIWRAGPKAVAERIAEVIDNFERLRLLEETRSIKGAIEEALPDGAASAFQRSHNNPPELIENADPPQQVLIIWAGLDQVEHELTKAKPDKSLLAEIAEWMKKALLAFLRKCGDWADKVVGALLVEVFSNGALSKLLSDLARYITGG